MKWTEWTHASFQLNKKRKKQDFYLINLTHFSLSLVFSLRPAITNRANKNHVKVKRFLWLTVINQHSIVLILLITGLFLHHNIFPLCVTTTVSSSSSLSN